MSEQPRRGLILAVIALLVGSTIIGGAVIQATQLTQNSSGVILNQPGGPTINLTGNTKLYNDSGSLNATTVYFDTSDGNATFTSTGNTSATLPVTALSGTWTNLTNINTNSTTLTINPGGKNALGVNGVLSSLSYRAYSLNDGHTDIVMQGSGNITLILHGLEANQQFTVVKAGTSHTEFVSSTNGQGSATITIPASLGAISLKKGDQSHTPVLSNPSPTGNLEQPPGNFSIGVNDTDFSGTDRVNTTISYNGSVVTQKTLSVNGTVSAAIPSSLHDGTNTWTVTATDSYGNTKSSVYSFNVPSKLYIFNVTADSTGKYHLITGTNVTVTATTVGSGSTVRKETVNNGIVNLTGLNPAESYVISVTATGYHDRSVYLSSLYEQSGIFMLNANRTSVQDKFTVSDHTGKFADGPALRVQRVINTSNISQFPNRGYQWSTIAGGRLGANNAYTTVLEKGQQYRLVLTDRQGDTRILGTYTASLAEKVTLNVGQVSYDFGNQTQGYEWSTGLNNSTGTPLAKFAYNDTTKTTRSVFVRFAYRGNNTTIASASFTVGPYGSVMYTKTLTSAQYHSHDIIVQWSAQRDSGRVNGKRAIGGQHFFDFGSLNQAWLTVAYGAVALIFGFAIGAGISAGAGALAVAGWSGLAWYIGLVPSTLGASAVLLAFLVATWTRIHEQRPELIR